MNYKTQNNKQQNHVIPFVSNVQWQKLRLRKISRAKKLFPHDCGIKVVTIMKASHSALETHCASCGWTDGLFELLCNNKEQLHRWTLWRKDTIAVTAMQWCRAEQVQNKLNVATNIKVWFCPIQSHVFYCILKNLRRVTTTCMQHCWLAFQNTLKWNNPRLSMQLDHSFVNHKRRATQNSMRVFVVDFAPALHFELR